MWINSWAVEHPDIRPKTMMTISKKRPIAIVASMTKIPIAIRMRKRIFLNIVVWFIGWGCRGRVPPAENLVLVYFPFHFKPHHFTISGVAQCNIFKSVNVG